MAAMPEPARARTLLVFSHPALERTRVNWAMAETARTVEGVTFHVAGDGKWPLPTDIAVTDWRRERTERFGFDGRHIAEELLFVPRKATSAEGDGWLVGTSLNLTARATELHVFDAARVAEGPVCTWRADVPLPVGFHGAFVQV